MNAANAAEGLALLRSLQTELGYKGPERRGGGAAALVRVLTCVLDEIDYGLVLIDASGHVIHINHGANNELNAEGSELEVVAKRLQCRDPSHRPQLNAALQSAQKHGHRSMLKLGSNGSATLSIVPLPVALTRDSHGGHAVLVTMQRNRIVEALTVGAYGRSHGLSRREEQVLALLCDGISTADIASRLGVSLATVRSHVHNLKAKTGCRSMVELLKQVAVLPPMVATLNRSRGDAIR